MIAQTYVDVGLAHLDKIFDYSIPETMEDVVKPGIRVKVRFAGRMVAAYVVGLSESSDVGHLQPIAKVVSDEVVLPEESVRLIRAVADHCAGTFMDVARLAVPPRYAAVEKGQWLIPQTIPLKDDIPCAIDEYPTGTQLREALRAGHRPRTSWLVAPVISTPGDWASGLAGLVADTVRSGRSAIVLVPDAKQCSLALDAVKAVVDPSLVVLLSADQGPQARYRSFLAAARGRAKVVVGTRAAAYAPVDRLGLIAVWDESDSSFDEPHFPYPHVRDIVAIRAAQSRSGVVFAARSRSAEIQAWVEKDWLVGLELPTSTVRFLGPKVEVASDNPHARDKDAFADSARVPHDVFSVIRRAVLSASVLVWVPWAGRRRNLVCTRCGAPMTCPCSGHFVERTDGMVSCASCGKSDAQWVCDCGSSTWKALTVGSEATMQELRAAFRHEKVVSSSAAWPIAHIEGEPVIVVSTPGCEPTCEGGFGAAIILDAYGFLSRPDLKAGEKAVDRWLGVASLVKSGSDGGTMLVVGPATDRAVQAVVRMDPSGFAMRELEDRREAGFPPAVRMVVFVGDEEPVAQAASDLTASGIEILGPFSGIDAEEQCRLIARVPIDKGEEFAATLQDMARRRSAREKGRLTWRLDPIEMG